MLTEHREFECFFAVAYRKKKKKNDQDFKINRLTTIFYSRKNVRD